MRGEILQYDDNKGSGYITGKDLKQYRFERSDLQQLYPVQPGMHVSFTPNGDKADKVFLLDHQKYISEPIKRRPSYEPTNDYDTNQNPSLWDHFYTCITDKYATFEGRANLKEYWSFILFYTLIFFVLAFVTIMISSSQNELEAGRIPGLTAVTMFLYLIAMIVPNCAVTVRRLHDIGLSGWFILLSFLPFGGFVVLFMTLLPSEKGANNFGPPSNQH